MSDQQVLVDGYIQGPLLVLDEPLSIWGGVDSHTGRIVDERHPQFGETVRRKIIVLPHGRGSSSSSSVLAEMLRRGTGPAGIVLEKPDSILVIGSLIANRLYGSSCPVVVSPVLGDTGGLWQISAGGLTKIS